MDPEPAPAGSQILPCDRYYSQSIPQSHSQPWGLSSFPSAVLSFPTTPPFPTPGCPECQAGSQLPVPPLELLRGLLCPLPWHCSCTHRPPGPPTSLAEERLWQGSCIKSQLRLGCGFNTFPFIPPPHPQVNTKLLHPKQSRSAAAAGGARAVPEVSPRLGGCPTTAPGLPGTCCAF